MPNVLLLKVSMVQILSSCSKTSMVCRRGNLLLHHQHLFFPAARRGAAQPPKTSKQDQQTQQPGNNHYGAAANSINTSGKLEHISTPYTGSLKLTRIPRYGTFHKL